MAHHIKSRAGARGRAASAAPVCVFCRRSGAGVQFDIFAPRFPPFGTACTDCEAALPLGGCFVIRSATERDFDTGAPLYWSNADGWVGRAGATAFTAAERVSCNLPLGGEWEQEPPRAP